MLLANGGDREHTAIDSPNADTLEADRGPAHTGCKGSRGSLDRCMQIPASFLASGRYRRVACSAVSSKRASSSSNARRSGSLSRTFRHAARIIGVKPASNCRGSGCWVVHERVEVRPGAGVLTNSLDHVVARLRLLGGIRRPRVRPRDQGSGREASRARQASRRPIRASGRPRCRSPARHRSRLARTESSAAIPPSWVTCSPAYENSMRRSLGAAATNSRGSSRIVLRRAFEDGVIRNEEPVRLPSPPIECEMARSQT